MTAAAQQWFGAPELPAAGAGSVMIGPRQESNTQWVVQLNEKSLPGIDDAGEAEQLIQRAARSIEVVRGLGLPGQLLVSVNAASQAAAGELLASTHLFSGYEADRAVAGRSTVASSQTSATQYASTGAMTASVSDPMVVAVIDSGIDVSHPDLATKLWTNAAEIPGNGKDDDANGFVDDRGGWDFVNNDNNPFDDNGHGTAVTGVIVGAGGIARNVQIMPLKFSNAANEGNVSSAIESINYVVLQHQRGVNVRVINASWGFYNDYSSGLYDAIAAAGAAGIVFVAAAGNGDALGQGIDLDRGASFYPASFNLENIISVAAATSKDSGVLTAFSNFGKVSVDLAAPGLNVPTTSPGGGYAPRSGTSFAAPYVAGTVALVLGDHPDATVAEVREALFTTVKIVAEQGRLPITTGGTVNPGAARLAQTVAPTASIRYVPQVDLARGVVKFTIKYETNDPLGINFNTLGRGDAARNSREAFVQRVGFNGDVFPVRSSNVRQGRDGNNLPINRVALVDYEFDLDPTADAVPVAELAGQYQVVVRGGVVADLSKRVSGQRVLNFDTQDFAFELIASDPTHTQMVQAQPGSAAANGNALRDAIVAAQQTAGKSTILLSDGVYQVPGQLVIPAGQEIEIVGGQGGGVVLTPDPGVSSDRRRSLHVASGAVVTLRNLSIEDGLATQGGGILNEGQLTLERCRFARNLADEAGGALSNSGTAIVDGCTFDSNGTVLASRSKGGGAIYNAGVLTLRASTLLQNFTQAGAFVLGDSGGGAIFNALGATAQLENCTLAENIAYNSQGGAITNLGGMTLLHATILQNTGIGVGGVMNQAALTLKNSIVTLSFDVGAAPERNDDLHGLFLTNGHDLITRPGSSLLQMLDAQLNQVPDTSSITGVDALLDARGVNGGPTLTYMLLSGSPAIDAAEPGVLDVDQRGESRASVGNGPDLGAVERAERIIEGRVFNDIDGDGVLDANEVGIAGLTLFIDREVIDGQSGSVTRSRNQILDDDEPQVVTRADDPATPLINELGTYRFVLMVSGNPDLVEEAVTLVAPEDILPTSSPFISGLSSQGLTPSIADGQIVESGGEQFHLKNVGNPSLTSAGALAVLAYDDQGVAVYTGPDNHLTRLTTATVAPKFPLATVPVGFQNTLAFVAEEGGQSVIKARLPDGREKIVVPANDPRFAGQAFQQLSFGGLLLFRTDAGIYLADVDSDQPVVNMLIDPSTSVPDQAGNPTSFQFTAFRKLNADSTGFAFVADFQDGSDQRSGVFFGTAAGNIRLIADSETIVPDAVIPTATFDRTGFDSVSVAGGVLAFSGRTDLGDGGIYRWTSGDSIRVVANRNSNKNVPGRPGVTFRSFGAPDSEISSSRNLIVFVAQLSDLRWGVYAEVPVRGGGGAIVGHRLVELAASATLRLTIGAEAASRNQVAIRSLQNGRAGILIANLEQGSLQFVKLARGAERRDVNFGLQGAPARLEGSVYVDNNDNGKPDLADGEGQAGLRVFLDADRDGKFGAGETSVLTDQQGKYVFENLRSLTDYAIRLAPLPAQSSLTQSFPTLAQGAEWRTSLEPTQSIAGLDFVLAPKQAGAAGGIGEMRGRVVDDAGHPQPNWLVFLDAGDHNGLPDVGERTTRTNLDGAYLFQNLPAGNYEVRVQPQPNSGQLSPLGTVLREEQSGAAPLQASDLQLANFDGLNGPDLAIASRNGSNLRILLNDGFGGMQTDTTHSKTLNTADSTTGTSAPTAIAAYDFNSDGKLDIAVANQYGIPLSILFNNGSKTAVPFTAPVFFGQSGPRSTFANGLAVADFDGDHDLDIAVVNYRHSGPGSSVLFYKNTQSTNLANLFVFDGQIDTGFNAFAIAPVSLPGGLIDLAVVHSFDASDPSQPGHVVLLRNNTQPNQHFSFSRVTDSSGRTLELPVGHSASSITVARINADALDDLVVGNYLDSSVTVLFGQSIAGRPPFRVNETVDTLKAPATVLVRDMDGNGVPDLIVSGQNSDDLENNRGFLVFPGRKLDSAGNDVRFGAPQLGGVGVISNKGPFRVAADFVDNDNTVDVAVINPNNNTFHVYSNELTNAGSYPVVLRTDASHASQLDFMVHSASNAGFADSDGGAADDEGRGVATDNAGNSYVVGVLGHSDGYDDFLKPGGGSLVVAAYSSNGILSWRKVIPAAAGKWIRGYAVTAEPDGSALYVTGTYTGTVSFPGDTFGTTFTITSRPGAGDGFVARLRGSDGLASWVESFGASNSTTLPEAGLALALDHKGGLVVAGQLDSPDVPGTDVVVRKVNASTGRLVWQKGFGGSGNDAAKGVAIDDVGRIYVTGRATPGMGFGPTAALQPAIKGVSDAFLLRLKPDGTPVYAKVWGGDSTNTAGNIQEAGFAIAVDPARDAVYVAGGFLGANVDFNPGVNKLLRTSAGSRGLDAFVSKFDLAGNFGWASIMGSVGDERARGLTVLPSGVVVAAGHYAGLARFTPSLNSTNPPLPAVAADAFLWGLNRNGSFRFATRVGGLLGDLGRGVASYQRNNGDGTTTDFLLTTGLFTTAMTVDGRVLTSNGGLELFVVKRALTKAGLLEDSSLTPAPAIAAPASLATPTPSLPATAFDNVFALWEDVLSDASARRKRT